jgi:AcrR family transcriptional regulator
MPTPAKTSADELVAIGIALATEGGVDAVTIASVAKEAGIKGPSLYKHFADREALLTAIESTLLGELEATLRKARGRTPRQRIIAIAHAYRAFAKSAPRRYGMLYRKSAAGNAALGEVYRASSRPLFDEIDAAGVPPARTLNLARNLVAFMHGFVSMEIAHAFRLGGSLDEAFAAGLDTILAEL